MRRTVPAGTPEDDRARVVERPDGFYWHTEDRSKQYGPFPTLLEAVPDIQVPGNEIVTTPDHHVDLYAALHDAFHAAQCRLEGRAHPIVRRYSGNRPKRLALSATDT